jgi:hypothetical protein
MDLLRELIMLWRSIGDEDTSEIMEAILADEIQHVRYANRWLRRLSEESPRVLMDVIKAMQHLGRMVGELERNPSEGPAIGEAPRASHSAPPSIEDRRLAEFSEREIREMLRLSGYGSIAPKREA